MPNPITMNFNWINNIMINKLKKVIFEKMRNINTSGRGNVHERNSTLGMRILDDTSHTPTGKSLSNKDADSSIIKILSKRGHDLISNFISGFFTDRKPEQSATISD